MDLGAAQPINAPPDYSPTTSVMTPDYPVPPLTPPMKGHPPLPPRISKWTESLVVSNCHQPRTHAHVRSLPPGLGLGVTFPTPGSNAQPPITSTPCKRSNSSTTDPPPPNFSSFMASLRRRLAPKMSSIQAVPPRSGTADRYGNNFNSLALRPTHPHTTEGEEEGGRCRECGCALPDPPSSAEGHALIDQLSRMYFHHPPGHHQHHSRQNSYSSCSASGSLFSSGYSSSSNFSLYHPHASAHSLREEPNAPTSRLPQITKRLEKLTVPGGMEKRYPYLQDRLEVICNDNGTEPDSDTNTLGLADDLKNSSPDLVGLTKNVAAFGGEKHRSNDVDSTTVSERAEPRSHTGDETPDACRRSPQTSYFPVPLTATDLDSTTVNENDRATAEGNCPDIVEIEESMETGTTNSPSRTTTPSLAGTDYENDLDDEENNVTATSTDAAPPQPCSCLCHDLYAYGLLSSVQNQAISPFSDVKNDRNQKCPPPHGCSGKVACDDADARTLREHSLKATPNGNEPIPTTDRGSPNSDAPLDRSHARVPSPPVVSILASVGKRLNPNGVYKVNCSLLPTSCLILENRPKHLPPKQPNEELKHKSLYNAMIEAAKKKEAKESKIKKKLLSQKLKDEEKLAQMARIWNTEIIPNWEIMRNHKKTRALMSAGIPPSVRGKVWFLAIGNELNITNDLFDICVERSKNHMALDVTTSFCGDATGGNQEESLRLIQLDVSRTFPNLCIFQKDAPYHELLHDLLSAYVCYRPDIGYVQGMSYIAAVLLLNMEVKKTFICFANLLNTPCFQAFFRMEQSTMQQYFNMYRKFFRINLPKLYDHFESMNFTPDLYLTDWIYTIYSKSLPLDVACRLWDVFLRDGEEFLFRTALGILKLYEDILLKMDFMQLAEFLTKLADSISANQLFERISTIDMSIPSEKKGISLILANAPRLLNNI